MNQRVQAVLTKDQMVTLLMKKEQRPASARNFFFLIYRAGNLVDAHHVLGITAKRLAVPFAAISRIDAPVNEASELCFAPPGDP